ncbi:MULTISPECIES: S8 family serine peptidase [Paenibacillus]|uniref:SLH domain-containing protein n=1 Tax=Paenibacillus albilobatus TaxID=2716884 RepID=A0A920CC80_9BACL|nr:MULTISPECIES: S8 family serine peptidase [Paenibacillus]GIO34270.1 hypothetical protein J2TS6_54110 [Paenibacillus albilobatus]
MKKGLFSRKLPIITLALGMTVGAVPGVSLASSSSSFKISNQDLQSVLESSQPAYISPQINTQSSKKVRVIVQLSGQPAAVGKYATRQGISSLAKSASEAAVQSQQDQFLDEVSDQGIDMKINYQYDTVLNGFEVSVPANEIPELAKIPGVKSIQENSIWYPIPIEESSANSDVRYDINPLKQIGATEAWAEGYTGKGLKIGVIDTGVDYTHPDIAPVYKGGYDSFYQDDDPYEEVPLTVDEDVQYHTGYAGTYHGTHVAGTIIGQYANQTSDVAQKGVAYGAELYAYKVLGRNIDDPSKSSGSSAQVIDGIERAVKDGMDVINLSLGSDSEKDVNSPDAIAINNAVLSGVVAVIANGNAGPGYFTMGSPATSQLGIAVGAVTSESKHYEGKVKPSLADSVTSVTSVTYSTYGDLQMMGWETAHENFADIIGQGAQDVVYVGLGDENDYVGLDVTNKVVLASRGNLAFVDKITNAKKHGAKAIVIFNGINKGTAADLSESIPGRNGFADVSVGDSFDFIPAFDMKGSEGRALARALLENPGFKLQFEFNPDFPVKAIPGDELADFTSWGPNADNKLSIKPDIMAPGVNILSTWPAYGKGKPDVSYDKAYNRISGTSMATPHVAGLALLIKEAHPSWNPFDIRAALANTADILPDYDVYQQGAGRVNVINAIHTNALLQAVEPITILDKNYNPKNVINYNSSASFGVVAPGSPDQVKSLQLKNTGGQALTFTASVELDDPNAGITATLDRNEVTAAANSTTPFQLTLNVGSSAAPNHSYEGRIVLSSPGQPELHLPFVVYVGSEQPANTFGVQELNVTNSIIYPNRPSQASTDLSFRLTAADTNYYEIDIVNLDDETIGFLDIQSTDDANAYFKPQTYALKNITNAYHPYDANGVPVLDKNNEPVTSYLKDGIYKINVVAAKLTATGEVAKRPNGSSIIYSGVTSFRVDSSVENNNGGGSGGGSSSSPSAPSSPSTSQPTVSGSVNAVVEQGQKQVSVTPKTKSENGVTTATVTDSDLKSAIASAANGASAIIINVSGTNAATITLTADQVKQLGALPSGSTVIVSASGSAVSIPVSVLGKAPAGSGFDLAIKPGDDQKSKFEAVFPGAKVLGSPVSFEAFWVAGTVRAAVEVSDKTFIKRSFTVPGNIEPNTAGVLFEEGGKITPVASVFKAQKDGSTIVTVSRPGFSTYAAVSRTVKFNDIAASPVASDITALANKWIIDGKSEGVFAPKGNLTRAEFTALLVRSLGLRSNAASGFSDVLTSDWYASDVAAAYQAGLIQGIGNNKFAPGANVTRQEMAVILDRALKLTGVEAKASNPSFNAYGDDAKVAPYAKDAVKSLTAAGIVSGEAGNFNPTAATTRETVAAALHQLLIKTNLID